VASKCQRLDQVFGNYQVPNADSDAQPAPAEMAKQTFLRPAADIYIFTLELERQIWEYTAAVEEEDGVWWVLITLGWLCWLVTVRCI